MSNMSYCRFRNTSGDLGDCVDALEERMACDGEALSREELDAAKELARKAINLLDLLAEHGDIDLDTCELERKVGNILDDINEAE